MKDNIPSFLKKFDFLEDFMKNEKTLPCVEINPKAEPTHVIIWMHGLGADGYDFSDAISKINLPDHVSVRFIFPHAPVMPITINGGMAMRAWFDIYGLNSILDVDLDGIKKSESLVLSLIRNEENSGISSDRIFLGGFSQGCVMALFTGLRYPKKLGGIMALSGFFPFTEELKLSFNLNNKDIPIFMAHGYQDKIVNKLFADKSKRILSDLGYSKIEANFYPMDHGVCPEEMVDLEKWINKIID